MVFLFCFVSVHTLFTRTLSTWWFGLYTNQCLTWKISFAFGYDREQRQKNFIYTYTYIKYKQLSHEKSYKIIHTKIYTKLSTESWIIIVQKDQPRSNLFMEYTTYLYVSVHIFCSISFSFKYNFDMHLFLSLHLSHWCYVSQ